MKCILTLAAFLAIVPASIAGAESGATRGLWSYDVNASLGGLPVMDDGNYCIDEDQAASTYEDMLNDINPNCSVTSGTYAGEEYSFRLTCKGGPDGYLDGTLKLNGSEATLRARGWTGTNASQLPVTVNAFAKKLSQTC